MGEGLAIMTTIDSASNLLNIIKDSHILDWEWSPEQLDVAATWLPRKGFEIIPKIFDKDYKPGTVGDEGDMLIKNIGGCYLEWRRGRTMPIPIWYSRILRQPQIRKELRMILDGNVLDISFEEEVVNELKKKFGEAGYIADEESLRDDNEALKRFAEILMKLAECIDQVKAEQGKSSDMPVVVFEFYIPRN